MNEERQQRLRGYLGRGITLSLLAHASLLFPFMALAIVFARNEADRRDLDVRFEDVNPAELPSNLPPIEPEPEEALPQAPTLAERKMKDEVELPPPETLPPLPKEDEKPQPPRPVPEKQNRKIVDLDMGKEVEAPPDAKYLAQKNNRAAEETRARDTNLEKEEKGEASSSPSDRQDEQIGDAEKKIAKSEDLKSKRGRQAPAVVPHTDPQLARPFSETPSKSLLSMREAQRRQHEITPETADPSLPRDAHAPRPLAQDRPESVRHLGGTPGTAQKPRLALSGTQYQYLFGDDAEAARQYAEKHRSKRQGRFNERMTRLKSALENFIPEVRPGNQTALNTRAAPFAAFIARMHRNIHELWGFGFLEDLDNKPASSPMNNPELVTKLEIILNGDGTIAKISIVRASGLTQFDVAAIDAVYSAGPFPDPPREIRSGNGKIYIHWNFHRDERACGTSGVDYYILDNPPAGADKGEGVVAVPGLPSPEAAPRLKRLERTAAPDSAAHQAKRRSLDREIQAAGGDAAEEPDLDATRRATQQVTRADDPAAREVAEDWFDAYVRGDVGRMLKRAGFPFRSAAGIVAKGSAELRRMLAAVLEESPGPRTVRAVQLYSPAGARGALGVLPPGFDEPGTAGVIFAVAQVSGDTFVLVLAQHNKVWKAVGLVRR